jgi:hypothetical protein
VPAYENRRADQLEALSLEGIDLVFTKMKFRRNLGNRKTLSFARLP